MICAIYKSKTKQDTFLYVPADKGLSELPSVLLEHFGPAELVMKLSITVKTRLASVSPEKLLDAFETRGFYLQLPPNEPNLLELHRQSLQQGG